MRVLVLGGTRFVGRAFVEEALAAGHEVTTFNRGKTAPELLPEVEGILGDRDGGLSVYSDGTTTGQDERGVLATIDDPTVEDVTDETYGALKVLSER